MTQIEEMDRAVGSLSLRVQSRRTDEETELDRAFVHAINNVCCRFQRRLEPDMARIAADAEEARRRLNDEERGDYCDAPIEDHHLPTAHMRVVRRQRRETAEYELHHGGVVIY